MKRIYKNFDEVPQILTSKKCETLIEDLLEKQNQHSFNQYYFAHEDIKTSLSNIYNNKCAYCETDTTAGAPLEVEHYRPKNKVKESEKHLGYYWLCYEWSNLLYSCSSCNKAKSNHFPLEDESKRVFAPKKIAGKLDKNSCNIRSSILLQEKPLLLNPEIDNPLEHVFFHPDGKIEGRSTRGEMTIEICKLNRQPLQIARKTLIDDIFRNLMRYLEKFDARNISDSTVKYAIKNEINKLLSLIKNDRPYSVLAMTVLKKFDVFYINRFGKKEHQKILREVYEEFKQTILEIMNKE